jgi:hypothetical protein
MAEDSVKIDFDQIAEGDTIRVVRSGADIDIVLQGVANWQDDDGDWNSGDELLTFKDSHTYEEEYYLIRSAALPTEPGTLVAFENYRGLPVFCLKAYGDEGWFTSFPDGSSTVMSDLRVATKEWALVE